MRRWITLLGLGLLAGCTTPGSTIDLTHASWQPLTTGTDASLRGICVVGDGVAWASGSGGTVLRTTDGGITWTHTPVPDASTSDVRDIEAIDRTNAWAINITEPARVLGTADGGVTWRLLHESEQSESFFDSLALLDDGGALVFGDPVDGVFEVLRSDDREDWSVIPARSLPLALEGEAGFAASGTCVVTVGAHHAWIGTGGRAARVLYTSDGGRRWKAATTPMRQGEQTTGIYSVAFRNPMHGVVVGGDYTKPDLPGENAAYTSDGGRTWIAASTPPRGYRSSVIYMPGHPRHLIAVGRGGCDYSSDGGQTWQPLGQDLGYYAVAASDDGLIIAVGSDGRAARLILGD